MGDCARISYGTLSILSGYYMGAELIQACVRSHPLRREKIETVATMMIWSHMHQPPTIESASALFSGNGASRYVT